VVLYSAYVINCIPNKSGYLTISPREAITDRKLSVERDLRISFDEYVQMREPYTDNSMKPRTVGGIALLSTGNIQGNVRFFDLRTSRVVVRYQFTILPLPEDVRMVLERMSEGSTDLFPELDYDSDDGNQSPVLIPWTRLY